MADTNEFDQFDAPPPTGGAAANANAFDQFDGHAKKPAGAAPPESVLSKAGNYVADQFKGTGDRPYDLVDNPVTRGLANAGNTGLKSVAHYARRLVGAISPEAGEAIRTNVEAPLAQNDERFAIPKDAGVGASALQMLSNVGGQISLARVTGGGSALGMAARLGVANAGAEGASKREETGKDVSAPRLGAMAAANTAANLIGLKLPGGLPGRIAGGVVSNVAGNALSNVAAGNDAFQGAVPAALLGAGLATLPHGARTAAPGKPGLTPGMADQAADLASGVDAHGEQLALPPGQAADFVAGANGETMTPEQARARAAGGAGMEQQAPGGPPPPVVPEPPAPLALGHEPDVIVDARGRAVLNKGDRTLGQPFGGPGLEEQAPPPPPPAGPLGRAAVAAGTEPTLRPPAEAAAPETAQAAPTAAAAEAPQQPAPLLQAYADRQAQIDAMNAKRKAGGLSEAENNQLHDLRDQHDNYDPLTGLLNQKGYDAALSGGGFTHAAALDLDQFKPVNDKFGHQAGDAVLQHVAQVLHDVSAGNVTVARLHGDEYAGLAHGDPTEAMAAAQKKLSQTPFTVKYVDKAGNPLSHTFDGIGITFGVGHNYETADAAANANKPTGGRRNTDTNAGPIRPEDVRTPAGGEAGLAARGGQDNLQGALGDAREVAGAADTARAGNDTHAASESGGAPAGGDVQSAGPEGVGGAALHERAAAESESRVASAESTQAANAASDAGVGTGTEHNFVKPAKAAPSKSGEPKFARGSQGGMSRDALAASIGETVRAWKGDAPRVEIHQSHSEAPPRMRNAQGFDQSVEGAYDPATRTVHLFADSLKTPERAAQVLAHEAIGHFGVERVLGDQWGKLVSDIKALREKPTAHMRSVFDEVAKRYPGASDDAIASETMAVMAERGIRNSLMDRAITAVRKFVRSLGIDVKFNDAELRQMLVAAHERVSTGRGDVAPEHGTVPAFSKAAPEGTEKPAAAAPDKPAVEDKPHTIFGKAAASIKSMYVASQATMQRENVRGDIRANWAKMDRAIGEADTAVRKTMDYYDRRSADVLKDPRKALADVIAFQKGEPIPDKNARPFFDQVRQLLDAQAKEIQSFGKGHLDHLVENYFPQMWKDPVRAEQFQSSAAARRPMSGDKKFLKQRVFENFEQGIAAGMEPISHNPVDMLMSRYQSGEKLLAMLRTMKAMEDRGTVRTIGQDERIPQGWARVNDPAFNSKIVPELVARDLNNHLDPGLTRFAAWRGFRYMQNLMLSARLGLSAFHAGMTTLDTLVSHADVAWRSVLNGDVAGGLHQLVKTFTSPLTSPIEGNRLMRQFEGKDPLDPSKPQDVQTAALFHALTEGGMRARMAPTDYNADLRKFRRALAQGDYKTATAKALPALVESTTHLIAHTLVPSQKMTARMLLAKFELDKVADKLGTSKGDYAATVEAMHPDALRQIMRKINADVDDRLGQFAYANEFWNKTVKDALHASVQSVGWNFGSARLLFGGAKDIGRLAAPEKFASPLDKEGKLTDEHMSRLTNRLGYIITLNAIVAASSAMIQYAMTGQSPESSKDWFFPRTGRKNADDSDERLSLPSYVKDEWELVHHPLTMVQHKLHPTLSMLAELGQNRDFYGTQIVDPNADVPSKATQVLTYFAKAFEPYAVSGAMKNSEAGQSATMSALPFIGVTPAPGNVARSPFQDYVAEKYFDTLPQGARSQAQAEQSGKFRQAVIDVRAGKNPDLSELTPNQKKALHGAASTPAPQFRFGKIGIVQQLQAWDMATPEERQQYKLKASIAKASRSIRNLPQEQRAEVQQKVRDVLSGG